MSPAPSGPIASQSPKYYIDEVNRYFDTIDFYTYGRPAPHYAENVIRWEWHPWLLLTGYGRWSMHFDVLQKLYPTHITNRSCASYDAAPQVRCHVSFAYIGSSRAIEIYEEFTFNDAGEIAFIEAWSDSPEVTAQAEAGTLKRMSLLHTDQSSTDPDVLDFRKHAAHPLYYWFIEAARFSASLL